jgi:predicted nucleic acid-binding protein
MGLILDTSILIADERGKFDLPGFLMQFPSGQPLIAAVTASELLHGVERAQDAARRTRRQQYVEQILAALLVQPFDLSQARRARTNLIGAHDLQIAAAGISGSHQIGTLNAKEFQRVPGLQVLDASPFRKL